MAYTGAKTSTVGLTPNVKQFFYDTFLEENRAQTVLLKDAEKISVPVGFGSNGTTTSIEFTRCLAPTKIKVALSEGDISSTTKPTFETVTATIAEYGTYEQYSSMFNNAAFDRFKEITKAYKQQHNESVDFQIKKELATGLTTAVYVNSKTSGTLAYTDVPVATDLTELYKRLMNNKVSPFEDGTFHMLLSPEIAQKFKDLSDVKSAYIYTADNKEVQMNQIAIYGGIKLITDPLTQYYTTADGTADTGTAEGDPTSGSIASAYAVANLPVYGKKTYAVIDYKNPKWALGGGNIYGELVIKTPNENDTSNPLNRYMTIGWIMNFVCKVLNANNGIIYRVPSPTYATS